MSRLRQSLSRKLLFWAVLLMPLGEEKARITDFYFDERERRQKAHCIGKGHEWHTTGYSLKVRGGIWSGWRDQICLRCGAKQSA